MNQPEISQETAMTIVIVHFNEMQYMPGVLDSLANQDFKQFKVMVVDNNSRPENRAALETLLSSYPSLDIELVKNKHDVYYPGGNNTVLRQLQTPFVCIMNPDINFGPDLLANAMAFFNSEYKPDLFTPKAIFYTLKNRIWYAGAVMTPLRKTFSHHIGYLEKDSVAFSTIHETAYANGACLFIKKEVLDSIGYFDELFFLSCDDADLSLRAKKNGFKVFYNGEFSFCHKVKTNVFEEDRQFSLRNSKEMYYLLLRNKLILLWRYFSLPTIVASYGTWCAYNLLAASILNIKYKRFHLLLEHIRAIVMGTIIGIRRRTHKSCKKIMRVETRYVKGVLEK
jgi:hypothetical protein